MTDEIKETARARSEKYKLIRWGIAAVTVLIIVGVAYWVISAPAVKIGIGAPRRFDVAQSWVAARARPAFDNIELGRSEANPAIKFMASGDASRISSRRSAMRSRVASKTS